MRFIMTHTSIKTVRPITFILTSAPLSVLSDPIVYKRVTSSDDF